MHAELARLIIQYLTVLTRISLPSIAVGLPAISSESRKHYPSTRKATVQPGESLSLVALRVWNDTLLW